MTRPSPTVRSSLALAVLAGLLAYACYSPFDLRAQTASSAPDSPSLPASSTPAQTRPARPPTLATQVPGDVMLYLEMPGLRGVLPESAGANVLAGLLHLVGSGLATLPAGEADGPAVQELFAATVGLESGKAVDALLSGPLAVAADGWSGLSDAVLVAWPKDAEALEADLAGKRVAGSTEAKVRRYELSRDHQLACDGKTAVVGRMTKRTGLYARTIDLLEGNAAGTLADQAEFRERMASLPTETQYMLYIGKSSEGTPTQDPLTAWWPDDWPRLRTVAMGLVIDRSGVTVKVSGRLDMEGPQLARSEPPVEIIRRLPTSVVGVWTHVIDYVGGFRRLRTRFSHDPEGFHFDSLETGLEPGVIEKRLLGHLVGDSVLLIDRVDAKPVEASRPDELLALPAAALMVETDDPDAVAGAIGQVAGNLVRLLNQQLPPEQAVSLQEEAVVPGGPVMYSLPIGRVLGKNNKCDLLQSLQLCVTVADRWLVVATHPQTLRRLVEARRGGSPLLPVYDLDRMIESVAAHGGQPRRILFAQPRASAGMVGSWLAHINEHHPDMLQPQWWEKVLRRQRAMGKQMGLLARAADGTVEVVDTLPGGPARDRLQPGDRIVAVDGAKLAADSPVQSLRASIANRKRAELVTLSVQRGGPAVSVDLPLPDEQAVAAATSPVALLRRFAQISRLFGSASYVLWQPRPDVVDARIDLRYTTSTQPAHN